MDRTVAKATSVLLFPKRKQTEYTYANSFSRRLTGRRLDTSTKTVTQSRVINTGGLFASPAWPNRSHITQLLLRTEATVTVTPTVRLQREQREKLLVVLAAYSGAARAMEILLLA